MRDDMAVVVGVRRIVLHDNTKNSADKLDIGSQGPERPEYRGDAQLGMIEAFAEHLHLDNAVQCPVLEIADDLLLLIRIQLAVDNFRPVPALFVERANTLPVIDRARDRDDLMFGAGQAELFEFFQAVIDDAYVAGVAEG